MGKRPPYWIKERHNPQFEKPYYVACGQMTTKEAKRHEDALYGENYMHRYGSLVEYDARLAELRANGERVIN